MMLITIIVFPLRSPPSPPAHIQLRSFEVRRLKEGGALFQSKKIYLYEI